MFKMAIILIIFSISHLYFTPPEHGRWVTCHTTSEADITALTDCLGCGCLEEYRRCIHSEMSPSLYRPSTVLCCTTVTYRTEKNGITSYIIECIQRLTDLPIMVNGRNKVQEKTGRFIPKGFANGIWGLWFWGWIPLGQIITESLLWAESIQFCEDNVYRWFVIRALICCQSLSC